jgi:hypothetical protein
MPDGSSFRLLLLPHILNIRFFGKSMTGKMTHAVTKVHRPSPSCYRARETGQEPALPELPLAHICPVIPPRPLVPWLKKIVTIVWHRIAHNEFFYHKDDSATLSRKLVKIPIPTIVSLDEILSIVKNAAVIFKRSGSWIGVTESSNPVL